MENTNNLDQFSKKINSVSNIDNQSIKLRDIHIVVEKIYEHIKNNKSSFIYKTIFYMLYGVSFIVFLIHIKIFNFSFSTIFLILLILYLFYYIYSIKKVIKENILTKPYVKIDPENSEFLKNRIDYISEGIKVTTGRAIAIRNFYIIFFPFMAMTLVDILKGPFDFKGYVATFIVSELIGGVFWYFYFKIDISDLESDMEELEELKTKITAP